MMASNSLASYDKTAYFQRWAPSILFLVVVDVVTVVQLFVNSLINDEV